MREGERGRRGEGELGREGKGVGVERRGEPALRGEAALRRGGVRWDKTRIRGATSDGSQCWALSRRRSMSFPCRVLPSSLAHSLSLDIFPSPLFPFSPCF